MRETIDVLHSAPDGTLTADQLVTYARHRLRVLVDRRVPKPGMFQQAADADAAIDRELLPWLRAFGHQEPYVRHAEVAGIGLIVHEDLVPGGRQDDAVSPVDGGRWARRPIAVARRCRVTIHAPSVARVHQRGIGEDFELVVDAQLGLWVRRWGKHTALRRDEDGIGVSLLVLGAT